MPLMCSVCKSSIHWNKEEDKYPCYVCEVEDTEVAQCLKISPRQSTWGSSSSPRIRLDIPKEEQMKFQVVESVSYDRMQEVEAVSMEEAIKLAKEYNDWEGPIHWEYNYEAYEVTE